MNKKLKKIIFPALILIAVCTACSGLQYLPSAPYTKVIWKNWGIALPSEGARDLYAYSVPSPHGDGVRYHVIDYEIDNASKRVEAAVSQLDAFFNDAPQPTEDQVLYVEQLLAGTGIEDEELPDWKSCRLVYQKSNDNSEIFLFFWSGTGTLYVVESFL